MKYHGREVERVQPQWGHWVQRSNGWHPMFELIERHIRAGWTFEAIVKEGEQPWIQARRNDETVIAPLLEQVVMELVPQWPEEQHAATGTTEDRQRQ